MKVTPTPTSGAADLRTAAQAVVDRWDTPLWKDAPATAEYIGRLRAALASAPAQPVAEPADTVVLNAAMRAIQQAIELIGAPTDERMRAVRRVLRGAVIVAEDDGKVAPLPSAAYAALPEPLEIDWPELHSQALGCGVEDRGLHNRYECAEYGWQDGVDKCAERVPEQIFDADQMRAFADATHAIRASHGQAPSGVLEDAARWHWMAEYIVGTRTDLDDELIASATVDELRKLVDADLAARAPADSVTAPAGCEVAGWQMVPIKPTHDMLCALSGEWHPSRHQPERYAAMLAAAPTPPAQAADSVLEDADPLQGAANWLAEAHGQFCVAVLQGCLMIGYNRAKRLHDAALAARKQGANHDNT